MIGREHGCGPIPGVEPHNGGSSRCYETLWWIFILRRPVRTYKGNILMINYPMLRILLLTGKKKKKREK